MEVRSYDLRCIRVEEKLALLYRNCGRAHACVGARHLYTRKRERGMESVEYLKCLH